MERRMSHYAVYLIAYICLGLLSELPTMSTLGIKLSFIVIALMCVRCAATEAITVAALGSTTVSLIATGWFPVGGFISAVGVAFICAAGFKQERAVCPGNVIVCLMSALVVCGCIATGVEALLFSKPYFITAYKNAVCAGQNSVMLIFGLYAAEAGDKLKARARRASYER